MTAALLAEAGITSAPAVFDEPFGFFGVFPPFENHRELLAELGTRFLSAEISLKPYPCGVVIHPAIDGCIAIAGQPGFDAASVQSVDIFVHPRTAVLAEKQDPSSAITSRFSLHHAAALALTYGNADFDTFETADVADPALAALRRRMQVHRDEALPQTQARLAVTFADGTREEEFVTKATGGPDNPLSDAQLERKFVQLCGRAMDEGAARALYVRCIALGDEPDVAGFMKAVGSP